LTTKVGDDLQAACLGGPDELDEVAERAQARIDGVEVRDVVAVVDVGGRVERHQPDDRDAEVDQVVEALGQSREIADTVAVGVAKGLHVEAVDDRGLPPEVTGKGGVGGGEVHSDHVLVVSRAGSGQTCARLAGSPPACRTNPGDVRT